MLKAIAVCAFLAAPVARADEVTVNFFYDAEPVQTVVDTKDLPGVYYDGSLDITFFFYRDKEKTAVPSGWLVEDGFLVDPVLTLPGDPPATPADPTATPEPSTLVMAALSLLFAAILWRRHGSKR